MTNLPTRETLEALVEARYAEMRWNDDNDDFLDEALIALSDVSNVGTAANQAYAEAIGPDYICALEDGTIAAWGGDMVIGAGVVARKLVFVAPADQVLPE